MSISIQITVQQELSAGLDAFLGQLPRAVANALAAVASRVVETENVLVPVRTGLLKSTLGYRQDSSFQVTFYAEAPYASYVEFGTARMPARLFLTRSIQQHQDEFPQQVKLELIKLKEKILV